MLSRPLTPAWAPFSRFGIFSYDSTEDILYTSAIIFFSLFQVRNSEVRSFQGVPQLPHFPVMILCSLNFSLTFGE